MVFALVKLRLRRQLAEGPPERHIGTPLYLTGPLQLAWHQEPQAGCQPPTHCKSPDGKQGRESQGPSHFQKNRPEGILA